MTSLDYDLSVRVVSYKNHLGHNLQVDDAVKLGDMAIAQCSESGKTILDDGGQTLYTYRIHLL